MQERADRRSWARVVPSLGRIVPLLLAVGCLLGLELGAAVAWPTPRRLVEVPRGSTRLVVFFIDSLATEDVETPGRMPNLQRRLPGALHGPMRTCTDALSVACFTAMQTGVDRFSLFSVLRNFGAGADGIPEGSMLRVLQRDGRRIGYLGDFELASTVVGFDVVDTAVPDQVRDATAVDVGLALLEREGLDVMVIHMDAADQLAHKHGAPSAPYLAELLRMDAAIEAAWARLRPTDHVVVLGDHGHDAEGQHFTGLEVPTYAAFFGPRFGPPRQLPLALTDVSALWAHAFGYEYGPTPWVRAALAGTTPASPRTPVTELPPLRTGHVALDGLTVTLALAAIVLLVVPMRRELWAPPRRVQRALLLAVLLLLALAAGATYMDLRPSLHYRSKWFNRGFSLACAAAGMGLLAPWLRVERLRQALRPAEALPMLFGAGALLVALPTIYKYGGAHVAVTGALGMLGAGFVREPRARGWPTLALLALLLTLWNPRIKSFMLFWFSFYSKLLAGFEPVVTLAACVAALALLCQALPTRRRALLGWGGAGLLGGALVSALPAWVYAVPCGLALPALVAASRREAFTAPAMGIALSALAFFFELDFTRLAPMSAVLLGFAVLSRAAPSLAPLERSVLLVLWLWLAMTASMGNRISGIDFQYFFRWLPASARVESSAGLNGLLTLVKYACLPLLGSVLALRIEAREMAGTLAGAWYLAKLKLGLCLAFLLGFLTRADDAGPFVTSDVVQEAGLWVLIVALLAGLPMRAALERGDGALTQG